MLNIPCPPGGQDRQDKERESLCPGGMPAFFSSLSPHLVLLGHPSQRQLWDDQQTENSLSCSHRGWTEGFSTTSCCSTQQQDCQSSVSSARIHHPPA